MMSFDKKEIESVITSAESISDLVPFIKHIPLNVVKEFVIENMNKMTESSATKMTFNALSINQIMPADVIQRILTFTTLDGKNIKSVNKQWRDLSELNEKIYYTKLIQRLDEECKISYDPQKNKTWLIHPTRNKLTKIEKGCGFKGPYSIFCNGMTAESIFLSGNDGDRFLVHPGRYTVETFAEIHMDMMPIEIRKSICIIGVGGKSQSTPMVNCDYPVDYWAQITCRNSLYIENIVFEAGVQVMPKAKLWLNDCDFKCEDQIQGNSYIDVLDDAFTHIINCRFEGIKSAITISPRAMLVYLKNNFFRDYSIHSRHSIGKAVKTKEHEPFIRIKKNKSVDVRQP